MTDLPGRGSMRSYRKYLKGRLPCTDRGDTGTVHTVTTSPSKIANIHKASTHHVPLGVKGKEFKTLNRVVNFSTKPAKLHVIIVKT